jgi:V/A-type H+-transporting ATPase subunit K
MTEAIIPDVATLVLDSLADSALLLQQQEGGSSGPAIEQGAAAALGIGLAAIGAGYAERGIGAAAVGALAEDSISTGIGIVLTVLPETLVIFALVALFV